MGDRLVISKISKAERLRKTILDQVIARQINRREGRKRLGISDRQMKQILSHFR